MNKPTRKQLGIGFGAALLAVFTVLGVSVAWPETTTAPTEMAQSEPDPEPAGPVYTSAEGRYMFSGTVVLSRAVERAAGDDPSQPFSEFASFNPAQYDDWLVDLECPVTSNLVSYRDSINLLLFNCPVPFMAAMREHISILNLANNHSGDMGADGFAETLTNLEQLDYQYVGSYDPLDKDRACEVIGLNVRLQGDGGETPAVLPVAMCAFHYFFNTPEPGAFDVVAEYAEVMPVFGFMHAGAEYVATAGAHQRNVARQLIDAGAEFVIGNSPHWVQDSEVYKGKPIFYSTGNFIFDQLDLETNRGLNIDIRMSIPYNDALEQWLAFGQSCRPANDSCLEQIKSAGLSPYALDLTYLPVASLGGAWELTRLATEATQTAVEQRLNWAETSAALGQ